MPSPTLLVATRNPGKMREYRQLLADYPGRLISLDDAGVPDEVDETGDTFHANAILKAATYARLSGHLTISDDSGLEVHALGGEPGVYSARYGGDACKTDADRVTLLLRNLADVSWERRIARFSLLHRHRRPTGLRWGTPCRHRRRLRRRGDTIRSRPANTASDTIRYSTSRPTAPPWRNCRLEAKNRVSHRADAARKARRILNQLTVIPAKAGIQ